MANANQDPDSVALLVVPCLDCGKLVVTFVAKRGQFAGEPFYNYKRRNHNPGRGGCDFYMWQEAYAEHLATLGPVAQINQGQQEIAAPNQGCQMQAADGGVGQQNGAPEASHLASAASEAAGSSLTVAAVAQHQATIALDPASINFVVSVGK